MLSDSVPEMCLYSTRDNHTAIVAQRLGVSQTLVALLTAGAEWEEVLFYEILQCMESG